jgi:3-deoxy-manno-octulosonate cytidylyltransferase (CMP-KDO synthetase)
MADNVLIMIPARMAATRLPGKPLLDIAGLPMIVHVLRRAQAARLGPVVVATDAEVIAACVEKAGGRAVMTRTDHASGSDRIYEALGIVDPKAQAKIVINMQGDLPTLPPADLKAALGPLADPAVDIATLAAEIKKPDERTNPNVVKVVGSAVAPGRLHALYFTRATAPTGDGPLYHHIGLYAYRRAALAKFVALPPSPLERREKLEQLRALEAGMRIDVAIVDSVPLGVDTPEELEIARAMLKSAR